MRPSDRERERPPMLLRIYIILRETTRERLLVATSLRDDSLTAALGARHERRVPEVVWRLTVKR